MRPLLVCFLLVGCGGSGDDQQQAMGDAAVDAYSLDGHFDGPAPAMTLTSPTITDGGTIPLTHVCVSKGGQNQSPQLVFTNVPAGTQSFAVVLTDMSNALVHCAIYDIPATNTGLPANVDKIANPTAVPGAKQTPSYQSTVVGYNGPCPPNTHTYQFKLYALGTANLSGITTKENVVSAASASNLGTATLTATFTP